MPRSFRLCLRLAILAAAATAPQSARACSIWSLSYWILGSGLAYLFVFRLFANWGATRTTLVAYLIPVVGIVLGYLVLAEPIDATIIVGTALVIAGIGLVNSRYGRRRLFGRAQEVLPGGVNSPVRAMRQIGRDPIFVERGEGCWLFDVEGNRYVDWIGSWGRTNLPGVVPSIR